MPKKFKPVVMAEEETLTNEDFLAAIKKVMDFLEKKQGDNKKEIIEMAAKLFGDFNTIKEELAASLDRQDGRLSQSEQAIVAKLEAKLSEIDATVKARLAELKDGESPAVEAIVQAVVPYIPAPLKGSPDMAEDIRNKLELLEGDERLKIDSIKDLREELDKIVKMIKREATMFAGGGIRVQQSIIFPAETLDDSTTTYTFGQKPQRVVINGASYREGKGWSWVNEQVVLDSPVGSQGDLYGLI